MLCDHPVPVSKILFLVANTNSSFYSRWSLSHSVTSHFKGLEVQRVRKIFKGWKIFIDDEGQSANRGVSLHSSDHDYTRPQRPFRNDSFATRGFQTFFIWMRCRPCSGVVTPLLWLVTVKTPSWSISIVIRCRYYFSISYHNDLNW